MVGRSAGVICAVYCKAVSLSFVVLLPLLELESHPGSKCVRHWNVSVGCNMSAALFRGSCGGMACLGLGVGDCQRRC